MDTNKEYILCAAIKRKFPRECQPYHEGTNDICSLEIGYRHHDIFQRFRDELDNKPKSQGFYTSHGRYVDRKEAMKIAYAAGQVSEERAFTNRQNNEYSILYSEDLY